MTRFIRLILPLSLFLFANGSEAANLLVNPDLDQANGLSGWTWDSNGENPIVCSSAADCGNMHYSASDCCNKLDSGAVASKSSFFYTEELTQCIPDITANTSYDLGAWMRLTTPSGFEAGLPYMGTGWYASTDCSGDEIGRTSLSSIDSETWTRIAVSNSVAPAGTHSARFLLIAGPTGLSGTAVDMEFDSAFFGPSGTVPIELQSFSVD
ncbi:MAG: hypothetical protein ABI082_02145 [Dokdonella sp.]